LSAVVKGDQASTVLKKEEVRVWQVLTDVLQAAEPSIRQKGITVNYSPQADLPSVVADAEKIKDVFTNLVDNAVKFNKENGTIEIKHAIAGGFLRTDVRDTGLGIDPTALPRLFTPYFRAAGKGIWGTGLGLYIVKNLVEKMGGRVEVQSTPDVGSTFTVSLPLAER